MDYWGCSLSNPKPLTNQTVPHRASSVQCINSMPDFATWLICGLASIHATFHGIQVVTSGKRGKEGILLMHYLFMQLQQQSTRKGTLNTINETFSPFTEKRETSINSVSITVFASECLHYQIIFTVAWMRKQFGKQVIRTRWFDREVLWRCCLVCLPS